MIVSLYIFIKCLFLVIKMNDSNAESCITINDDNEEAQTHSSSDFLCSQQDPQYAGTVVSNSDSNSLRFASVEYFVMFILS